MKRTKLTIRNLAPGRKVASRLLDSYIRSRDEGICIYCKDEVGAVLDHVLAVKHGGPHIKENIVLACKPCNNDKKDRLCEAWIAKGFKHLLDVGESLEWVDRMFHR